MQTTAIIIQGTPAEIAAGLRQFVAEQPAPPPPPDVEPKDDRIKVEEVTELTGLSKSMIYKLSMLKQIPHKKFTRYLVFSRKEILEWIEKQTVNIEPGNKKASRELAKLAMKRT